MPRLGRAKCCSVAMEAWPRSNWLHKLATSLHKKKSSKTPSSFWIVLAGSWTKISLQCDCKPRTKIAIVGVDPD